MILITTSFTIQSNGDYLYAVNFFQEIVDRFFELEMEQHPDYYDVYVYTITYPLEQGVEYAERISLFCNINILKLN